MDPRFFCPVHDECNIKNDKTCTDCLKKLHKIQEIPTKKKVIINIIEILSEVSLILSDLIKSDDNDK